MLRQSRIPFPRKPWGRGGGSYPAAYTFGLLLSARGLGSVAYLPAVKERRALGRNRVPFWHVLSYNVQSQASDNQSIAPTGNFVALSMMATPTTNNQLRTQFRQIADEGGMGFNLSRVLVDNLNQFGTAQRPFIFRHLYPMPNHLSLLNRMTNLATTANVVQICIYGVKDREVQK